MTRQGGDRGGGAEPSRDARRDALRRAAAPLRCGRHRAGLAGRGRALPARPRAPRAGGSAADRPRWPSRVAAVASPVPAACRPCPRRPARRLRRGCSGGRRGGPRAIRAGGGAVRGRQARGRPRGARHDERQGESRNRCSRPSSSCTPSATTRRGPRSTKLLAGASREGRGGEPGWPRSPSRRRTTSRRSTAPRRARAPGGGVEARVLLGDAYFKLEKFERGQEGLQRGLQARSQQPGRRAGPASRRGAG